MSFHPQAQRSTFLLINSLAVEEDYVRLPADARFDACHCMMMLVMVLVMNPWMLRPTQPH
jgi:hypothetical protein